MQFISIKNGRETKFKNLSKDENYFIICTPEELIEKQDYFKFDSSTIIDCVNYDENVRFSSFSGYDFISMIHFYLDGNIINLSELNIYVGAKYLVLVLPGGYENTVFNNLKEECIKRISNFLPEEVSLNRIYYCIFDWLLTDLSNILEVIEDNINEIEDSITKKLSKDDLGKINNIKSTVYKIKKHVRPLLYIGDQFLINENKFIEPENLKFFKNIDVRINKIFDFCVSIQEFANQVLIMYESRVTMQTNDIVTKLTVLTLFFAPLTIITGIYGMNFEHMPELKWTYGYPFAFLLMILVLLIIYILLKIRKWI